MAILYVPTEPKELFDKVEQEGLINELITVQGYSFMGLMYFTVNPYSEQDNLRSARFVRVSILEK